MILHTYKIKHLVFLFLFQKKVQTECTIILRFHNIQTEYISVGINIWS